jgi:methionine--tRNA ligase beta chain
MENVNFQEWEKLDLRVAKIIKVEEIEGADKLYKLEVDLGKKMGKRTLVAGLKEHYKKDELKGKQIIVFCNLEPRMMKGVKSEGMLLAAVSEDHKKVFLLQPDKNSDVGNKVS